MRAAWLLGLLLLLCLAPHARATQSLFHPDLADASARLSRARGPEAYAALRRIWSTWDRANPSHVEELLLAASQDKKLTPAVQSYAGLLWAYARIRRGDLDSAQRQIRSLGYIDDWLILGSFDNEGKGGLEQEFGPEAEFDKALAPGRAYSGKERPVRWRKTPPVFPYGWVDLSTMLRPEAKICAFATTFLRAKDSKGPRSLSLWVGASGAFKLYFNGRLALTETSYRGHDADRHAVGVTLEPGLNNLTLKVCGDDEAPVFSLRVADQRGAAAQGIEASADIADSQQAAQLAAKLKGKKPGRVPDLEGPLEAFQRSTKHNARAPDLYAFADYLNSTGGDDPTVHDTRNLARKAAESEPSIERLLLAGALSEDRNQWGEWIGKAEKLAQGKPNIDVLLARAAWARSGPNWRLAFPIYDRVLALDPDEISAIRGRVELYNQAGLSRTALSTLERALERNPHSVNLLNMVASQLRSLGRTTEAEEVESRYHALRFDDRSFVGQMVDLAVKRRDKKGAERWLERLLRLDPESQWALSLAAETYRRLGQSDRAVATYKRALTLAPEDVGTLRTLADLHGELGDRDRQLALLREILKLKPQDRDVREYVEHIEPPKPRPDEAYAWGAEKFLKLRALPPGGNNRRTLRDLTVTTVFANGLASKFRQVVFQPLTDAAAAMGRQYAFQYQADRETVQLRGAKVYRSDGRIDEAIEYGEAAANDPSIAMYTSARNFYIQLPRLEPGDVVELRYRIDDVTPRNEFADYFGEVVYMQDSEPTANAEYVLITPKSRKFYIDQRVPNLKTETKEKGNQRIYRFFASEVPEITPEPAMPPWPEVLGFVHVSTYRSWQELGKWYWGLAKDQFDLDDETKKLVHEIAKGKKTTEEKVTAVYDWVVKNTRYVALEFGIYGFKPRRCVQTVARGWGDCKDKATVIVSMLKELGIPSTIVVLRTQLRGGFNSKVASLAPFDHAIAYVPSLDLYLDGTAEYTGAHELPRMDQGALGLQINQGNTKLVHLPLGDPNKNVVERKLSAAIAGDGSAKLEVDYDVRGSSAAEWRRRYHADATRRERINGDLGQEFPGFAIAQGAPGINVNDLEDIEQPVKLKVKGAAPSFARREGDQLSIPVTTGVRLTNDYASLSRRRQDVKILGFSTLADTFTIKLPAGTKVISAPANAAQETQFGSYSVKVETSPGQVVVKSRLSVKASRITPKEYNAWKKFCSDADRALSPRLIVGP